MNNQNYQQMFMIQQAQNSHQNGKAPEKEEIIVFSCLISFVIFLLFFIVYYQEKYGK